MEESPVHLGNSTGTFIELKVFPYIYLFQQEMDMCMGKSGLRNLPIIKRALPFNVFDNEDFESFFKQFRPFPLVKQLQKLI